jgi:hypothetical protein
MPRRIDITGGVPHKNIVKASAALLLSEIKVSFFGFAGSGSPDMTNEPSLFSTPFSSKAGGWRETIPFDEQVATGAAGFLPLNVIVHKSAIERR